MRRFRIPSISQMSLPQPNSPRNRNASQEEQVFTDIEEQALFENRPSAPVRSYERRIGDPDNAYRFDDATSSSSDSEDNASQSENQQKDDESEGYNQRQTSYSGNAPDAVPTEAKITDNCSTNTTSDAEKQALKAEQLIRKSTLESSVEREQNSTVPTVLTAKKPTVISCLASCGREMKTKLLQAGCSFGASLRRTGVKMQIISQSFTDGFLESLRTFYLAVVYFMMISLLTICNSLSKLPKYVSEPKYNNAGREQFERIVWSLLESTSLDGAFDKVNVPVLVEAEKCRNNDEEVLTSTENFSRHASKQASYELKESCRGNTHLEAGSPSLSASEGQYRTTSGDGVALKKSNSMSGNAERFPISPVSDEVRETVSKLKSSGDSTRTNYKRSTSKRERKGTNVSNVIGKPFDIQSSEDLNQAAACGKFERESPIVRIVEIEPQPSLLRRTSSVLKQTFLKKTSYDKPNEASGQSSLPEHGSPYRVWGSKRNGHKATKGIVAVKDSISRVIGKLKNEHEATFTSPCPEKRTMAIISDLLVKNFKCNVAIRKSGTPKIRCERHLTDNRVLRISATFQSIDERSAKVIINRSKEDDMSVSNADYLQFVTQLQKCLIDILQENGH